LEIEGPSRVTARRWRMWGNASEFREGKKFQGGSRKKNKSEADTSEFAKRENDQKTSCPPKKPGRRGLLPIRISSGKKTKTEENYPNEKKGRGHTSFGHDRVFTTYRGDSTKKNNAEKKW